MQHSESSPHRNWIGGIGMAALALSGCAARTPSERTIEPAVLTVELAGTTEVPGSLSLHVESVVLMPTAGSGEKGSTHESGGHQTGAADPKRPTFMFALEQDRVVLDPYGTVLAREVRVVPGRYRALSIRLGDGSTLDTGDRQVAVSGGGIIPVDLEIGAGDAITLDIELDARRSLSSTRGGAMLFKPVASVELLPAPAQAQGAIRGRVVPADAGAMIVIYASGAAESRSFTFADPRSGDFALEELPVGDYRVEVNPLEPAAFEARIFNGVGVPLDGLLDLGAVDLGLLPRARSQAGTFPAVDRLPPAP